jgi:hypothetical protein
VKHFIHDWRQIIVYITGGVGALLLARLVLRLFAARLDNPFVQALYGVTAPLVAPLAVLDAGQPRFGAVLEYSTLVCILLLLGIGGAVAVAVRRWNRANAR